MKQVFKFTLFSFLISNHIFCQKTAFDTFFQRLNELEQKQQFEIAYELINDNMEIYPDKWFQLSKELIYINDKEQNFEQNLKIFNEAHQKGYFYFIHPNMEKYQPYLSFPEFDSIAKRDLYLRDNAIKKSRMEYDVQFPTSYKKDSMYPLAFIFHGGGKSIIESKKHWNSNTLNNNYIKVYLQSYIHFDSETYGWGTLNDKLNKEIQLIYEKIKNIYFIDTSNIILCGISSGAMVSIDIAMQNKLSTIGLILFCPTQPRILNNMKSSEIQNLNMNVFIVCGEDDYMISKQKDLIHKLDSLRIKNKYIIVKNMGHQYPENETELINQALYFINNNTITK